MKKTLLLVFSLWAVLLPVSVFAGDVVVTLTNMENDEGYIVIAICPEAGFMKDYQKCWNSLKTPAKQGEMKLIFAGVPEGLFGVMVYHDMNANNRMDTGLFGIPTEGHGVSNNARGRFGAPSFKDASFKSGIDSVELEIHLRY